jgi:hypothetical protein
MRDQLGNPRDFGVNDKPRCPNCGEPMFLTRRSPAADYALQYERQKFTCPGCNQESERVVDAAGKPIAISGIQLAHDWAGGRGRECVVKATLLENGPFSVAPAAMPHRLYFEVSRRFICRRSAFLLLKAAQHHLFGGLACWAAAA